MLSTVNKNSSEYMGIDWRNIFDRTIKELQDQLAYERLRREKLECQLDEYRAEVDQLKETLEKIQVPTIVVSVGVLNTFILVDK